MNEKHLHSEDALVVLSGGQDSTLCAAIARKRHNRVYAITFDYGQRHIIERESAREVAQYLKLDDHEELHLGSSILRSASPLVNLQSEVEQYASLKECKRGVEPTFIPGRNILFLCIAANRAAHWGVKTIYIGVCEADFAGYWDCRNSFISAMNVALGEGIFGNAAAFRIATPLMYLSKSDSVRLAIRECGENFEPLFERTHTCYLGTKGGCGACHACLLRDRGFRDAEVTDPIWKFRNL